MSKNRLADFLPKDDALTTTDLDVSRHLMAFANRTTRRSFLSFVGRGSLALMGASFFALWKAESAYAACGSGHGWTERLSCMCSEIGRQCGDFCCSGYWIACPNNTNNPAACYVTDPAGTHFFKVKLYDCCKQCASNCDQNVAGCSGFGNDSCCSCGYCFDGCGSCSSGWRVKCIKKECTNTPC